MLFKIYKLKMYFFFSEKLYNIEGDFVDERHRHRYEVNPTYTHLFEEKGFIFVGHDTEGMRMEVMELRGTNLHTHNMLELLLCFFFVFCLCCYFSVCFSSDHPFFIGVQFHPEFKSRPLHPSAPYLGLILASCGKLKSYLLRGNNSSPR